MAEEIADQFVDYSKGSPLNGVVNAPSLSNAHGADNQPWITLSTAMGQLLASILPNYPTSNYQFTVTVFSADTPFTKQMSNIVMRAALIGMLNRGTVNGVNLVNSPTIAKERGITVDTTIKTELPDNVTGASAMEVSIVKDDTKYSVVGGCAAGSTPVIYSICDSVFTNGVTLNGNVVLYKGKQTGFSSIIGSLSALGSISSALSSACNKQGVQWFVVRTDQHVEKVEDAPVTDASFTAQLTF